MTRKKSSQRPRQASEPHCISLPSSRRMFRPTRVEIDCTSFLKNIRIIRSVIAPSVKILAVVKADAYGHMAVPLCRLAEKEVAMLGVSSIEEGVHLRENRIKKDILILGSIYPLENLKHCLVHGLTPTISSLAGIEELARIASRPRKPVEFHLKVDTGMGRVGVSAKNAIPILDRIVSLKNILVSGIYTHFSAAGSDPAYTMAQLGDFKQVVEIARRKGMKFIAHAANSDALFLYPESHFDMVRPGISLYGLWHDAEKRTLVKLEPVLSWKTKIVFLKKVTEGTSISYGRTFIARRPTMVATLPVGYADGYRRDLSNRGMVLIRGVRCPVIGRVTMDMIMVDVTDLKRVDVGDEVVLIGRQDDAMISAKEIADIVGTINYEIVCGISYRVPRVLL